MKKSTGAGEQFGELLEVMARLRGAGGCPWDKKQTHESLKASLLEETYELLDAIDGGAPQKLSDELGDILHQVIFHCQIASEHGQFNAEDVVAGLKKKLIRRHPHVFSGSRLPDVEAVLKERARIKAGEKQSEAGRSSLGELPKAMPALARAQRVTERASQLGFDWPSEAPVWRKIEEELAELKAACSTGDKQRTGEEMGDLLFSLVNLSRFLGLQAEEVLAQTVERFIWRFHFIETKLREANRNPATASLQEMDCLWDEAKLLERQGKTLP